MSIASAIQSAQAKVAAAYTACDDKGATMPATQNLANLPDTIDSIPAGGGETWRKWTRPSEWPQYTDSMIASGEVVYLTYDCRGAKAGNEREFISIRAKGAYQVERGSVSNGTFTAVATTTKASGGLFLELLPTNEGDYVVYRITPQSGAHIEGFGFDQFVQTGYSEAMPAAVQPCVERFARLPYVAKWNLYTNFINTYRLVSDTIKGLSSLTDCSYLYQNARTIERCVLEGTITVTNLSTMFSGCPALYDLDISKLKVTTSSAKADNMFSNCYELERINFGNNWSMSGVTRTDSMFRNCPLLREVKGTSGWALTSVTDMDYMFGDCFALKSIEDSGTWTSSSALVDMQYAFNGCRSLEEIDLSKLTVSGVTNFCSVFFNCISLVTANLSSWVMTAATRTDNMFRNCYMLEQITFGANGLQTSSALTNCSYTFGNCYCLKSTDVSGMVTSGVTDCSYMFSGCNSIMALNISNFNFTGVTTKTKGNAVVYDMTQLRSVVLPSANMPYIFDSIARYCRRLEQVVFPSSVTSVEANAFANCSSMLVFDFRNASTVPSLANTNALSGNTKSKIVVPDALYSSWIAATNWSSLASRIVSASDYTD